MNMSILERVKLAHAKTGAPGTITLVTLRYYKTATFYREYKFRMSYSGKNGKVTVFPSWTVGGCRQRKQATV